jgi:hypothetical protein
MKLLNETKSWSKLWAEHFMDDDFYNEPAYLSSTAREYDRKIPSNSRLFGKLKKYVNRDSTIFDIGAETGYLTLTLAPYVKKEKKKCSGKSERNHSSAKKTYRSKGFDGKKHA